MRLETGSRWLDHAIRDRLRDAFRNELHRAGRDTVRLQQATLDFEARMRGPRAHLTVRFEGGRHTRETFDVPWDEARGMAIRTTQRYDITWQASLLFSTMLEDHYVELECASLRTQLEEAQRTCAQPDYIQRLAYEYAARMDHARRYHQTAQVDALNARESLSYDRMRDAWRMINASSGSLRPGTADNDINTAYLTSQHAWYVFGDPSTDGVGSKEAQEKAIALLNDNLTPYQQAQYAAHKYFDVIGGKSGKTYRIKHGRQMNIHELNDKGEPVQGWCFLPQGGLAAGDVMLAQKNALEVCEDKALKVANKFHVVPGGYSGFGADVIIIDDPAAAEQPSRHRVIQWYGTRLAAGTGIVRGDVTA